MRCATRCLILAAGVLAVMQSSDAASSGSKRVRCEQPSGYRVVDCRLGKHGTPDLSRRGWRARHGSDVTISKRIDSLAANPAADGAARWPLVDSLGQQHASLEIVRGRFGLLTLGGTRYRAGVVNVRGRGCAADFRQQRRFTLVQIIARSAPASGTQGFLDIAAVDASTPAGRAARAAFRRQRGTGCGPKGPERGRLRPLPNPRVGAVAHARLSSGKLNTVTEYDAKPLFGNIVYFSSNTTSVFVGGIARGMVRVGTPAAKVDEITRCDPNSDGTLTWRYWSIRTANPRRPRMYGWIPAPCPARSRRPA